MVRYGGLVQIQAGQITGSVSSLAWLLTKDCFATAAIDGGAQSILNGGGNLRAYTDATKTTQIPVDIVTFVTGGAPDIAVWVQSPSLSNGSTIYIEADTVAISQPAVDAPFGRNATWTQEKIRHHLIDNSTTQVDSSGNDDGTLGGSGATTSVAAKIPPTNLNLNGSSWVEGLSDPVAGETHMAVRCWYKIPDDFSKGVSGSWAGDGDMSYLFFTGSNDLLFFRLRAGSVVTITSTTIVQDGAWHHLAAYWDGSTMRLLVDGVEEASASNSGTISAPASASYNIGRYNAASSTIPDSIQEHAVSCSTDVTVNYIKAEYNNQSNPAAFAQMISWEDQDAGGGFQAAWAIHANQLIW